MLQTVSGSGVGGDFTLTYLLPALLVLVARNSTRDVIEEMNLAQSSISFISFR